MHYQWPFYLIKQQIFSFIGNNKLLLTSFQMGTEKFISITYMMMDIMTPITALSQFFQTENVDVALVKVRQITSVIVIGG